MQSLRKSDRTVVRRAAGLMLLALAFQLALGIGTVMTQVAIPIAATHQVGAVVLLTAVLYWIHTQTDGKLTMEP